MKSLLYNYTMEYYSAIKIKEPLLHTTACNLKIITLSKKIRQKMHILRYLSYKTLEKTSYSDRRNISSCLRNRQGRKDWVLRKFKEINMHMFPNTKLYIYPCKFILCQFCHKRLLRRMYFSKDFASLFQIMLHRQQSTVVSDGPLPTD